MVDICTVQRDYTFVVCAVERSWNPAGESPVRQLVAPAGSNSSIGGGNEAVEALRNGRVRRSASQQAVTRVNVEQASKSMLQEPTLHNEEEGCHREASKIDRPRPAIASDMGFAVLPGY